MEPEAKYIYVGSAVVILVALAISFCVWIYRTRASEPVRDFTVYFKNISMAGLQVDSNVTMRGIKVGRVVDIDISPKDIQLIKVEIEVVESVPVKTDTRAVLMTSIISGLAYIDLVGSSQQSPILEHVLEGEDFPIIQQGESDFQAVAKSVPEVLSNVNNLAYRLGRVAEQASGLLSEGNLKSTTEILKNLAVISGKISQDSPELKKALDDLAQLIVSFRATVEVAKEDLPALLESVRATSDVVNRELVNMSSDVHRAAESVSGATTVLENPREAVFGASKESLGPAEMIKE